LKRKILFVFILLFLFSGLVQANGGVTFGGSRLIAPGETFRGDMVIFGGRVEVLGTLEGDLVCVGGDGTVEGRITGDLISVGSRLRMERGSSIGGDLVQVGGSVWRDQQVQIGGTFRTVSFSDQFRIGFPGWVFRPVISPWGSVLGFFYQLLFTLLVAFLFANNVKGVASTIKEEWGLSLLVGFLGFILLFPVVIFLLITILGIPLALVVLLGYYLAVILGQVGIFFILGDWLLDKFGRKQDKVIGTAAVGLLAIFIIRLIIRVIPFIGGPIHMVIMALIYMLALGVTLKSRFGTNKPWIARG